MSQKPDYYEILNVNKNSTQDEIKKAYRKLAIHYHPDRNPGNSVAEEKFKEAKEAYEILSDTQKRAQYDRFGHAGINTSSYANQNGNGDFGDIFDGFEDLFEGFFGKTSSKSRRSKQKGEDLHFDLEIEFEEAIYGKTKNIKIPSHELCNNCNGSGAKPGTSPENCQNCSGSGKISRSEGFFSFTSSCGMCRGTGIIIKHRCSECYGKGVKKQHKTISIKIPAGIDTGTRIKVSGAGSYGGNNGESGDLYIIINIKPHEFFERKDNHLYCTIPLSFSQLALGTNISVPLPSEKKIKLKIPSGTQTNQVFCIRGNGIKSLHNYSNGNLYVKIIAETPKNLSEEQKQLLEKFAYLRNENLNPKPKSLYEKIKNSFK